VLVHCKACKEFESVAYLNLRLTPCEARGLVCFNTSTCIGGMQFTAVLIPNASVNIIIDFGSLSVFIITIFSNAAHKCGEKHAIAEEPIGALKMLRSDWYCIYACSSHKCKYWYRPDPLARLGLGPSEIGWCPGKTILQQIYWPRALNKSNLLFIIVKLGLQV